MQLNISIQELTARIKSKFEYHKYTVKKCCKAFNDKGYTTSDEKPIIINKDFLSRVLNGNFQVFNLKISKLCELLGVNTENQEGSDRANSISREISEFTSLVNKTPKLKKRFSTLISFLDEITSLKVIKEEK